MAKGFQLTAEINLRGPSNIRQVVSNIRRQLGTIDTNVNVNVSSQTNRQISTLDRSFRTFNNTLAQTRNLSQSTATSLNQLGTAARTLASSLQNIPQNMGKISSASNKVVSTNQKIKSSTQEMTSEFAKFGKDSALAIRRFAAFAAPTAVIFKLSNAIASATKDFIEFDKALIQVAQVTDVPVSSLGFLTDNITLLSTKLGVASNDLIGVSRTLSQAGLSAKETSTALEALAQSALAPSFDNLNDTVEGSIALMRQFNIGANDLSMALGSINAVAAKFAVEAGDIVKAIQRTGGVFASASKGVSEGTDALNEFIAVFTSVRATTRESAETIATGLRTIFTRIQREDTINALKGYGVALTDLEGKFVGPYEAVRRLAEGLNQLDPREIRFGRIVEELGGFRQIGKVIPLIQQFTTAQQALSVAQQGSGSLAKDAAVAQLSLSNQIAKVREEFSALIRSIGQTEGFRDMVRLTLDLTSGLIRIADAAKSALPTLTAIFAIKGFQALTQFGVGFLGGLRKRGKADGGRILAFNQGGVVPGRGKGDTVPALLEPGEVVINNMAANKYGRGNLVKMNKRYFSGNSVERLQAGGQPTGKKGKYFSVQLKKLTENTVTGSTRIKKAMGTPSVVGKMQETDYVGSHIKSEQINLTKDDFETIYNNIHKEKKKTRLLLRAYKKDPDKTEQIKKARGIGFYHPIRRQRITRADSASKGLAFEELLRSRYPNLRFRAGRASLSNLLFSPLDFDTGDAKFGADSTIAYYSQERGKLDILSKRLRHTNNGLNLGWTEKTPERKKLRPTTVYVPPKGIKRDFDIWYAKRINQEYKTLNEQAKQTLPKANGGKIQRFPIGGVVEKTREILGKSRAGATEPTKSRRPRIQKKTDADYFGAAYEDNDQVIGDINALKIASDLYAVDTVGVSKPGQGYGVPLYDTVLEQVSKKGSWLTSSRTQVSEQARRIWDGYRKKRTKDVKNKLLPMEHWNMDPLFNGQIEGEPLNDQAYQFPQNLEELKKHKKTWPKKDHPVWALQYAYQKKLMSGGLIQSFKGGSPGGVAAGDTASVADILRVISINEAAKIGGISPFKVREVLKRRSPSPDEAMSIRKIREAYSEKIEERRMAQKGLRKVAIAGLGPINYSRDAEWILNMGKDHPLNGKKYMAIIRGFSNQYLGDIERLRARQRQASLEFGKDTTASEALAGLGSDDFYGPFRPVVIDFDETLAFGTKMIDPKTKKEDIAAYAIRERVEKSLGAARPTRLAERLAEIEKKTPGVVQRFTRVLTARPQSTADLVANTLNRFGLPYSSKPNVMGGVTGVSKGLGTNIAKAKADNLAAIERFIDDNEDNIKETKSRGFDTYRYKEPEAFDDSRMYTKTGEGNIEGALLEQALTQKLGYPIDIDRLRANRALDFPSGLGNAASLFGLPPDIETEVKRTLGKSSFEEARSEFERYFKENPDRYAVGGLVQSFGRGSPDGVEKKRGMQLGTGEGRSKKKRTGAREKYTIPESVEFSKWARNIYSQYDSDPEYPTASYMGISLPVEIAYANMLLGQMLEKGGAGLSVGKRFVVTPSDRIVPQLISSLVPNPNNPNELGFFEEEVLKFQRAHKDELWRREDIRRKKELQDRKTTSNKQRKLFGRALEGVVAGIEKGNLENEREVLKEGLPTIAKDPYLQVTTLPTAKELGSESDSVAANTVSAASVKPKFIAWGKNKSGGVFKEVVAGFEDKIRSQLIEPQKSHFEKLLSSGSLEAYKNVGGKEGHIPPLKKAIYEIIGVTSKRFGGAIQALMTGGPVGLYHGSNTGVNDSVLQSFKNEGAKSNIAQGYGQGAGFYVWSGKQKAIEQAKMRVKGAGFVVTRGDKSGKPMVLSFREKLNSQNWDLDYEMNKGQVVQWLVDNYDSLKDKVSPKDVKSTGIRDIMRKDRSAGIMSDAIKVESNDGARETIFAGTSANLREAELVGQIMNRLKSQDLATVAAFEKQFFDSPALASGAWDNLALKYVGSSPLKPVNIETFAEGGSVGKFAFGRKVDGPGLDEVRQQIIDKYSNIQWRISKRKGGFGYNLMGALKSTGGLLGKGTVDFRQPTNLKQLVEFADKIAAELQSGDSALTRKNVGGFINKFPDGGVVPALVSNGEAYVPPKLAQRIGYGTLNRMNQADRNGMGRFSEGGISVFRGPGSGTSDSIPTTLPVGSFIIREKATKALGLHKGGSVGVRKFQDGGEAFEFATSFKPIAKDATDALEAAIKQSLLRAAADIKKKSASSGGTPISSQAALDTARQRSALTVSFGAKQAAETGDQAAAEAVYQAQRKQVVALVKQSRQINKNIPISQLTAAAEQKVAQAWGGLITKVKQGAQAQQKVNQSAAALSAAQTSAAQNTDTDTDTGSGKKEKQKRDFTGISTALAFTGPMIAQQIGDSIGGGFGAGVAGLGANISSYAALGSSVAGGYGALAGVALGVVTAFDSWSSSVANFEATASSARIDQTFDIAGKAFQRMSNNIRDTGAFNDVVANFNTIQKEEIKLADLREKANAPGMITSLGRRMGLLSTPTEETVGGERAAGQQKAAEIAQQFLDAQIQAEQDYNQVSAKLQDQNSSFDQLYTAILEADTAYQIEVENIKRKEIAEELRTRQITELTSKRIQEIRASQEARFADIARAKASKKLASVLNIVSVSLNKTFTALNQSINAVSFGLEEASQNIQNIINDSANFTNRLRAVNILENPMAYSREEQNAAIRQTSQFAGSDRGFIQNLARFSLDIEDSLTAALNQARQGGVNDPTVVGQRLGTLLTSQIDSIFGPELGETIRSQFSVAIQQITKGDTKLEDVSIQDILEQIPGLNDQIQASKQVFEALNNSAKILENTMNLVSNTAKEYGLLQNKITENLANSQNIILQSNLSLREALGQRVTINQRRQARTAVAATRAGVRPQDFNAEFLSNRRDSLLQQKENIEKSLEKIRQSFDKSDLASSKQFLALNKALGETESAITRVNQGLENIPQNIEQNINDIISEISRLQQKSDAITQGAASFVEKLLGSTPQELEQIGSTFNILNNALNGQVNTIQMSRAAQLAYQQAINDGKNQQEAMAAAQQAFAGQTKDVLSLFNELSTLSGLDDEELRPIRANLFRNLANAQGMGLQNMPIFQTLLRRLEQPRGESREINELRGLLETERAALMRTTEVINQNTLNRQKDILEAANTKFINALRDIEVKFDIAQLRSMGLGLSRPGAVQPPAPVAPAAPVMPLNRASGGLVYASDGAYINYEPRGTDTIPAMLTRGEFVVNAKATKNNLGLLRAINSSAGNGKTFSKGGVVYAAGGADFLGARSTSSALETLDSVTQAAFNANRSSSAVNAAQKTADAVQKTRSWSPKLMKLFEALLSRVSNIRQAGGSLANNVGQFVGQFLGTDIDLVKMVNQFIDSEDIWGLSPRSARITNAAKPFANMSGTMGNVARNRLSSSAAHVSRLRWALPVLRFLGPVVGLGESIYEDWNKDIGIVQRITNLATSASTGTAFTMGDAGQRSLLGRIIGAEQGGTLDRQLGNWTQFALTTSQYTSMGVPPQYAALIAAGAMTTQEIVGYMGDVDEVQAREAVTERMDKRSRGGGRQALNYGTQRRVNESLEDYKARLIEEEAQQRLVRENKHQELRGFNVNERNWITQKARLENEKEYLQKQYGTRHSKIDDVDRRIRIHDSGRANIFRQSKFGWWGENYTETKTPIEIEAAIQTERKYQKDLNYARRQVIREQEQIDADEAYARDLALQGTNPQDVENDWLRQQENNRLEEQKERTQLGLRPNATFYELQQAQQAQIEKWKKKTGTPRQFQGLTYQQAAEAYSTLEQEHMAKKKQDEDAHFAFYNQTPEQMRAEAVSRASGLPPSTIQEEQFDAWRQSVQNKAKIFDEIREINNRRFIFDPFANTITQQELSFADYRDLFNKREQLRAAHNEATKAFKTARESTAETRGIPLDELEEKLWSEYDQGELRKQKRAEMEQRRRVAKEAEQQAQLHKAAAAASRVNMPDKFENPSRFLAVRENLLKRLKSKFPLTGNPRTDIETMTRFGLDPNTAQALFKPMDRSMLSAVASMIPRDFRASAQTRGIISILSGPIDDAEADAEIRLRNDEYLLSLIQNNPAVAAKFKRAFIKTINAVKVFNKMSMDFSRLPEARVAIARSRLLQKLSREGYLTYQTNGSVNVEASIDKLNSLGGGPVAQFLFPDQQAQNAAIRIPENRQSGGIVYASTGMLVPYEPRGTDTVPAMLTPGEFVVNREATTRHRGLLESINRSKGGSVKYLADGGTASDTGERITVGTKDGTPIRRENPLYTMLTKNLGYTKQLLDDSGNTKNILKYHTRSLNNIRNGLWNAGIPVPMSQGGVVYASQGQFIDFQPKGTDTVPAMLTPGEFVVNARSTEKNLGLLQAINNGYYNDGGVVSTQVGKRTVPHPADRIGAELSDQRLQQEMNRKIEFLARTLGVRATIEDILRSKKLNPKARARLIEQYPSFAEASRRLGFPQRESLKWTRGAKEATDSPEIPPNPLADLFKEDPKLEKKMQREIAFLSRTLKNKDGTPIEGDIESILRAVNRTKRNELINEYPAFRDAALKLKGFEAQSLDWTRVPQGMSTGGMVYAQNGALINNQAVDVADRQQLLQEADTFTLSLLPYTSGPEGAHKLLMSRNREFGVRGVRVQNLGSNIQAMFDTRNKQLVFGNRAVRSASVRHEMAHALAGTTHSTGRQNTVFSQQMKQHSKEEAMEIWDTRAQQKKQQYIDAGIPTQIVEQAYQREKSIVEKQLKNKRNIARSINFQIGQELLENNYQLLAGNTDYTIDQLSAMPSELFAVIASIANTPEFERMPASKAFLRKSMKTLGYSKGGIVYAQDGGEIDLIDQLIPGYSTNMRYLQELEDKRKKREKDFREGRALLSFDKEIQRAPDDDIFNTKIAGNATLGDAIRDLPLFGLDVLGAVPGVVGSAVTAPGAAAEQLSNYAMGADSKFMSDIFRYNLSMATAPGSRLASGIYSEDTMSMPGSYIAGESQDDILSKMGPAALGVATLLDFASPDITDFARLPKAVSRLRAGYPSRRRRALGPLSTMESLAKSMRIRPHARGNTPAYRQSADLHAQLMLRDRPAAIAPLDPDPNSMLMSELTGLRGAETAALGVATTTSGISRALQSASQALDTRSLRHISNILENPSLVKEIDRILVRQKIDASQLRVISSGAESLVFQYNDEIIKITGAAPRPNLSQINPLSTDIQIPGSSLRFTKEAQLDTAKVSLQDAQNMMDSLFESGYHWRDGGARQMGFDKTTGKPLIFDGVLEDLGFRTKPARVEDDAASLRARGLIKPPPKPLPPPVRRQNGGIVYAQDGGEISDREAFFAQLLEETSRRNSLSERHDTRTGRVTLVDPMSGQVMEDSHSPYNKDLGTADPLKAFGISAAKAAAPTAAGIAAGSYAAGIAGAATGPAAPIAAPIAGFIAGITAAGFTALAQEGYLDFFAPQANAEATRITEENPTASLLGGAVPGLGAGLARQGLSSFITGTLAQRATSGTGSAVFGAGAEYATTGRVDPTNLGINFGVGFAQPNVGSNQTTLNNMTTSNSRLPRLIKDTLDLVTTDKSVPRRELRPPKDSLDLSTTGGKSPVRDNTGLGEATTGRKSPVRDNTGLEEATTGRLSSVKQGAGRVGMISKMIKYIKSVFDKNKSNTDDDLWAGPKYLTKQPDSILEKVLQDAASSNRPGADKAINILAGRQADLKSIKLLEERLRQLGVDPSALKSIGGGQESVVLDAGSQQVVKLGYRQNAEVSRILQSPDLESFSLPSDVRGVVGYTSKASEGPYSIALQPKIRVLDRFGEQQFRDQQIDQQIIQWFKEQGYIAKDIHARNVGYARNPDTGIPTSMGMLEVLDGVIEPIKRQNGGMIYANNGMMVPYQPKGTDTVPAMLTPGEFVVNRQATQANLPLLKAINSGAPTPYSNGGIVYLGNGTKDPVKNTAISPKYNNSINFDNILRQLQVFNTILTGSSQILNQFASTLQQTGTNLQRNNQNITGGVNNIDGLSRFTAAFNTFITQLSSIRIPETINMQLAPLPPIQVVITGPGAEALAAIEPGLQRAVASRINEALSSFANNFDGVNIQQS